MLSSNQISVLTEFSRIYPALKQGDAWCYDPSTKTIYSPVAENKLKGLFFNIPMYCTFIIINGKTIERLKAANIH